MKVLFLFGILVLTLSQQGTVVDGNLNIGKDNTILTPGNMVKGDGNTITSLDPSFQMNSLFDAPSNPNNGFSTSNPFSFQTGHLAHTYGNTQTSNKGEGNLNHPYVTSANQAPKSSKSWSSNVLCMISSLVIVGLSIL